MRSEEGAAPPQARPTNDTNPALSQVLVGIDRTSCGINLSSTIPTSIDVRIRSGGVRYTSDPRPGRTAGLWRANWDLVPDRVSPFALRRIKVGRHGIEIEAIHPRTGNIWSFEGSVDQIADGLAQAGARLGFRGDRKHVFWAVHEFCQAARRQAAARGVAQ